MVNSDANVTNPSWPYRADLPQRYFVNYSRYLAAGGLVRRDEDVRAFVAGGYDGDMARFYFFCLALDQISKEELEGDVAEFGVYKGHTATLLANMARRLGRIAYLFDTYEGFSGSDLRGIDANKALEFSDTSLETVRALVGDDHVEYVKGHFPESCVQIPAEVSFCVVHIDCDLYISMISALQYFYPRMVPGGIMIIHDYSSLHWDGAERAIDEFFADKSECVVPLTDSAGSAVVRKARLTDHHPSWLTQKKCRAMGETWATAANHRLADIIGAGWGGMEEWGIWGVGDMHEINIYLPEPFIDDIVVDADVHVLLREPHVTQTVDVFVGDRKLAVWKFTESMNRGVRSVRIPTAIGAATEMGLPLVTLTFRPDCVLKPIDLDPTTADRRALGLALHRLRKRSLNSGRAIASASNDENSASKDSFDVTDPTAKKRLDQFSVSPMGGTGTMSGIRLHVDRCDRTEIAGWADRDGAVSSLDIELNGKWIGSVAPIAYRRDLEQAGLGDGKRAFNFSLSQYLEQGENAINVKFGGAALFTGNVIIGLPLDHPNAHQIAKRRWEADEVAPGLTWGRLMTGDSLWDLYQKRREFSTTDRILEVGPGYGRLLKTALNRNIPFASYTGVELSAARVKKLTEEYGAETIRFYQADIERWNGKLRFDAAISSATFEHLYPDCKLALQNIYNLLLPNGHALIDFISADYNQSGFEEDGTYVRIYSHEELLNLFRRLFNDVAVETCTLGEGAQGPVERLVVMAQRS
jgi:SAM-dependent methyltransferase